MWLNQMPAAGDSGDPTILMGFPNTGVASTDPVTAGAIVAPGANGTWAKFADATGSAEAVQATAQIAAGYIRCRFHGAVYFVPMFTGS